MQGLFDHMPFQQSKCDRLGCRRCANHGADVFSAVANPNVTLWDTSSARVLDSMFAGATSADPDVADWNVSLVSTMNGMFNGAVNADPDVSNWDVSKVTSMRQMFEGATTANPDVWPPGTPVPCGICRACLMAPFSDPRCLNMERQSRYRNGQFVQKRCFGKPRREQLGSWSG